MADIFSKEKRSWVMSKIRGKNTKIEHRMKGILSENRIKFEQHPKMFGNPDFIIKEEKIAIFCDGDFWHGYKYYEKKKPSKKFWRVKIEGNMKRDKRISQKLRRNGWSVLRFWEHDLEKRTGMCIDRIIGKIIDT